MTRSERVKESQLAIARGMKVPDEELKILDTVPDWAAREWLYVCALDHIPLNRVIEECGGNVTASKVKEKRGKYLNEIYKPSLFEAGDVKEELAKLQKEVKETCAESSKVRAAIEKAITENMGERDVQKEIRKKDEMIEALNRKIADLQKKSSEPEEKNIRGMTMRRIRTLFSHPFSRRPNNAKRFIEKYINDDRYSHEQIDFMLRCMEEGMSIYDVEKIAIPGASIDIMQRLKNL